MIIENQSYEILTDISPNAEKELRLIEKAGRTCYKSEPSDMETCKKFIRNIIKNGHESVLEHSLLTVKFTTSRAISHQLVRHRLASFSQESQRYCNYAKGKFGSQLVVIKPAGLPKSELELWKKSCEFDEKEYLEAIVRGLTPEQARAILPNSSKTELIMSANYREWRHIFKERTSTRADPNMRDLMIPLLKDLYFKIPVIFEDLKVI